MIRVDESDPVGELELLFPYRDVVVRKDCDIRDVYDLEMEIGRGKFGTVHKCREKKSEIMFAVKFVSTPRKEDKKEVEREIDIMNSLHHPRLLQLYDAFESVKEMCLVLELIQGGELFERVIDDDFILTEKACSIFTRQVCEGIQYMHEKNILHLDMKPENILCLTRAGNRIKLIDFGLARRYDPSKKLQVLFGTPEFVAPEVVNFDQIGFGTDMWSIGVICYVLLSGLSPFMGNSDVETMANVTVGEYDFEDEAFNDISDDAKDFINKLLVKDMNLRLSASDCLKHKWLEREPGIVVAPPAPEVKTSDGLLEITKSNLRTFVERWNEHPNSPYIYTPNRALSLASIPRWATVSGSNISMAVMATSPTSLHSQDVSEYDDEDDPSLRVHDSQPAPTNNNVTITEIDCHGDILLEDHGIWEAHRGGFRGDFQIIEPLHSDDQNFAKGSAHDPGIAAYPHTMQVHGTGAPQPIVQEPTDEISRDDLVSKWVDTNFREQEPVSAVVQRSSNVRKRPKRETPLVRDDSGEYIIPIVLSSSLKEQEDALMDPQVNYPILIETITGVETHPNDNATGDDYGSTEIGRVSEYLLDPNGSDSSQRPDERNVRDSITPTPMVEVLPFTERHNSEVRIVSIATESSTPAEHSEPQVHYIPIAIEGQEDEALIRKGAGLDSLIPIGNSLVEIIPVMDGESKDVNAMTHAQLKADCLTSPCVSLFKNMPNSTQDKPVDRSMVLSASMKDLIDEIASVSNSIEHALQRISQSESNIASSSQFEQIMQFSAEFSSRNQSVMNPRLCDSSTVHLSLPITAHKADIHRRKSDFLPDKPYKKFSG